jgi:hypothetical protein
MGKGSGTADAEADVEVLVERLHDHLAATEELPAHEMANRWLGEAQAVTADVVGGAPEAAVAKRMAQVRHLLENVDRTGNDEADRHVRAARELLDRIDERLAPAE